MNADEFARRFVTRVDEMGNTLDQLWEYSDGFIMVYSACVHGDDDGIDPVGLADMNQLAPRSLEIGCRVLRGAGVGLDEVFVLARATLIDLDSLDDLDVDARVLHITNPTHRGWMLFHVTHTTITHHHLSIDGNVRELGSSYMRPDHHDLHTHLHNLLVP